MLGVSKKKIAQLAKQGIIAPAGLGRYALEASVSSIAPIFASRLADAATMARCGQETESDA
jgi:hypothetical protein